ncbi:MAG: hypothetical protein B6227_01280 [Fusobacteriia bacterium 4572_74]|nr:MAG: hypothetical protein B6227_01280 [Fusobacteriia bacterium 4572_74]
MKILHDTILKDGLALSDSILKVDSFINHQIDPKLMSQVGKEFINEGENILLIDDFLSVGNAILDLRDIVNQGGATVVGVGIIIEKGFKEGRENLLKEGFHLKSLAIVEKMEKGKITLNKIK